MGFLEALEVVVALVVLAILPLVGIFVRRRWLDAKGGVFDCDLRSDTSVPGAGWLSGVARYQGESLEWYRTFSISLRPRAVLRRDTTTVIGRRAPDDSEAVMLLNDQQVVRLESRLDGVPRTWELAMSDGSATGLMSWLESAPPGGAYTTY